MKTKESNPYKINNPDIIGTRKTGDAISDAAKWYCHYSHQTFAILHDEYSGLFG